MPKEFVWEGKKYTGLWPDYVKEINRDKKVVWEWHAWDHIGMGPKETEHQLSAAQSSGVYARA